jgi:hypothetical protein
MLGLSTQYREQSWLATLNLVLIIAGYQLVATLATPFITAETSQTVTVPYRAFVLGLSLILIVKYWHKSIRWTGVLNALLVLWLIIILRFVYDRYIQSDFPIDEGGFQKVSIYMYGICIPSVISYAKTCKIVDYKLAMKLSLISFVIIAFYNIFFNPAILEGSSEFSDGRIGSGAALNTIAFGYCGASLSILALVYYKQLHKFKVRLVSLFLICVGAFIVMKAGSRGPFVVLIAVVMIYLSLVNKYKIGVFFTLATLFVLLFAFWDTIFAFVGEISPVMASRLDASINEGDSSGRDSILEYALKLWYDNNVFIGTQFAVYTRNFSGYSPGYAHNIIVDALIYGGLIGASIMVYFYGVVTTSIRNFALHNTELLWLILIVAEYFYSCLFSGSFWFTPILSCGIVLISQAKYIQLENRKFTKK